MESIVRSYVVRIYRFDRSDPGGMVGTVNIPESETQLTFQGMDELWEALQRFVAPDNDDGQSLYR